MLAYCFQEEIIFYSLLFEAIFIGQQHHILPKYSFIKFEGNFQPTLLFQPTPLLDSKSSQEAMFILSE